MAGIGGVLVCLAAFLFIPEELSLELPRVVRMAVSTEPAFAQFDSGRRESRLRGRSRRSDDQQENYGDVPDPEPPPVQQVSPPERHEPPAPEENAPPQPQAPAPVPGQPVAVPRPGRPVPGARPVVPVRPQPGGTPPAAGEEAKTTGIPPEGQMVLRLVPLEQKANIGEEFLVHVWLDNPEKKPFDFVSMALTYDPNLLEFVDAPGGYEGKPNSFDLSEKTVTAFPLVRDPNEDPFYLNIADSENGFVYYRARSASGESCSSEGFLLSLMFRAKSSIDRTGVRFVFADWPEKLTPPVQSDQSWEWPAPMTYVGMTPVGGGSDSNRGLANLLGDQITKKDGVISGYLTVVGEEKDEILDRVTAVPEGQTQTKLTLEPPLIAVQAGKNFDLNVYLDNPQSIPWDRIRLDLLFDHRFLEVVDTDDGNWLTRGVNILDGPYHDRFPFEFMRDNQARNESGRILYDCGLFRKDLRSGGVIATIRFLAKAPVPETRVKFHMRKDAGYQDGTWLFLSRSDVLGDTTSPLDGTLGTTIVVVPSKELLTASPAESEGRF